MERSEKILQGLGNQYYRATLKSMGFTTEDLKRPVIGIANAWSECVPGHYNLRQVAQRVKDGIYRAGGTPIEFGVIGGCDGMGQGHDGMHYILPSRELIANSIESMAQINLFDGLVLLGSCDKIVPGMLMAAARLDIPCIFLPGGPMEGGVEFDGRQADQTSSTEAYGMLSAGKITEAEYVALEDTACPGCGSCSYLGTANTMCALAEALGMTLPDGGLAPATSAVRMMMAEETGVKIMELRRPVPDQRDLQRLQPPLQSGADVKGPVTDGKHPIPPLGLQRHADGRKERHGVPAVEPGKGAVQKLAVPGHVGQQGLYIGVVGDVAPALAGDVQLLSQPLIGLQQRHPCAPLRRGDSGHHPGGSPADHYQPLTHRPSSRTRRRRSRCPPAPQRCGTRPTASGSPRRSAAR